MTALYSLYSPPLSRPHTGWSTTEANMIGLALSVEMARRTGSFDRFVFTGDAGALRLADACGIDFDETRDRLSDLPERLGAKHATFWSLGKMVAMADMTEPFAHLDHDLFLGAPLDLTPHTGEAAVFETCEDLVLSGYSGLIKWAEEDARQRGSMLPSWWGAADKAANCGIVIGQDLDVIHRWCRSAIEWVESPRMRGFWKRALPAARGHTWCVMFEQYSASCVAAEMGARIGYLDTHVERICGMCDGPYVHLISVVKRTQQARAWAKAKLRSLNPAALERIEQATLHTSR